MFKVIRFSWLDAAGVPYKEPFPPSYSANNLGKTLDYGRQKRIFPACVNQDLIGLGFVSKTKKGRDNFVLQSLD